MKTKSKKILVSVLIMALAIGLAVSCILASVLPKAQGAKAWEKNTTVTITSDVAQTAPGGKITLYVKARTEHTDTVWSAFSLLIVPLKEDTVDAELAGHFTLGTVNWGAAGNVMSNQAISTDAFRLQKHGAWLHYAMGEGAQGYSTDKDIDITVEICLDDRVRASEITFGIASTQYDKAKFGDGSEDWARPVSSYGKLICNSVTVKMTQVERLELATDSQYQFLRETEEDGAIYRDSYEYIGWTHGTDDVALSHDYVLGHIRPETDIRTFLSNIEPCLLPLIRLYKPANPKFPEQYPAELVYDRGTPTANYADFMDGGISIGTGWYLEIGTGETPAETVYLSVLGDVNGDGILDVGDVEFFRSIITGIANIENFRVEYRLAAYIDNVGTVSPSGVSALYALFKNIVDISEYYKYPI